MVKESHLPAINPNKKAELEVLRAQATTKVVRPSNPKYYGVDSYKSEIGQVDEAANLGVARSIDWNRHKNPLIKKEAPKEHNFVKIDYLRFNSKQEVIALGEHEQERGGVVTVPKS